MERRHWHGERPSFFNWPVVFDCIRVLTTYLRSFNCCVSCTGGDLISFSVKLEVVNKSFHGFLRQKNTEQLLPSFSSTGESSGCRLGRFLLAPPLFTLPPTSEFGSPPPPPPQPPGLHPLDFPVDATDAGGPGPLL